MGLWGVWFVCFGLLKRRGGRCVVCGVLVVVWVLFLFFNWIGLRLVLFLVCGWFCFFLFLVVLCLMVFWVSSECYLGT